MTYMGIERRAGEERRTLGTTVLPSATSSGISRSSRDYDGRMDAMRDRAGMDDRAGERASLMAPGLLCGIGLGGLIYGMVFHRLLDWHHVLSNDTPMTGDGIGDNLRADGLFDLVSLIILLAGIALLWSTASRMRGRDWDGSGVRLTGWILLGWSVFYVVEGVLFHFILDAHHVNETAGANEAAWDWGLLILSVVVGVIGLAMTRSRGNADSAVRPRTRSTLPDVPPGRPM